MTSMPRPLADKVPERESIEHKELKWLTHQEIKKLLQVFKNEYGEDVDITNNRQHNQSELKWLLNEYDYDKRIGLKYKNIYDEIHYVTREPTTEPTTTSLDTQQVTGPVNEPETLDPWSREHSSFEDFYEERNRWDDDDEYENEMKELMKQREEIDKRINELKEVEKIRMQNELFINDLMNIETPEIEMQRSHKERYKEYIKEATNFILDGEIDESLNEELTKFIKRHPFKHLRGGEDTGAIILFAPIDKEKFRAALRRNKYATNSIHKEENKVDINYYLNRCTELGFIFNSLDRIYDENKQAPFKITFDCGFIVEDTKTVSYERTAPTEEGTNRSIPVVIKNKSDLNTYKHYVLSAICEKSELTHKSSSHRYIAIHTVLFKVFKLTKTGSRCEKLKIEGFDILTRNKYACKIPGDFNLCTFCCAIKGLRRVSHTSGHTQAVTQVKKK